MASHPDTSADDLRTLAALNRRFIHNFVTNDVPSHDAILHPTFVQISTSGAYLGRAAYLDEWRTGFDPKVITYWDMRDQRITVIGDTALVRAVTRWVRVNQGQAMVGMTLYTDTYVRTAAGWLCAQAHLSPVSEANYPDDASIEVQYLNGVQVTPPGLVA